MFRSSASPSLTSRARYAAAAALVIALPLAGCDRPEPTSPSPVVVASPTPTPKAVQPAGPERLILAFGDSLYAGFGLLPEQSLPEAVETRLRARGLNAEVVNAGVSGETTAGGRQRLAFVLDNMTRKPDLVLLGLGGNDLLRQLPPTETRANLVAMLDVLAARRIPVVLTGMRAPPNFGEAYVTAFDAIWPDLARRYDGALDPFILEGVIGDPALMQVDRIHPNSRGVARIADRLAPLVAAELTEAER